MDRKMPETGSSETIAYELFLKIAAAEGKVFDRLPDNHGTTADRDWILSTYNECLKVVRGFRRMPDAAANNQAA